MALPTRILPSSVLDKVKRSRPVYSLLRKGRFRIGSFMGARKVEGFTERFHYNDFMLSSTEPQHIESYTKGAVAFVDILQTALKRCGKTFGDVQKALEVGCGYGRIVRQLKTRMPPSRIHVCDVIDEAASFTASEFGVQKIPLLGTDAAKDHSGFDLIYLLSVYTHMPMAQVEDHIKVLAHALRRGGVLVFTTHGASSAANPDQYQQYWLDSDKVKQAFARDEYYYERYPYYYDDYGMTWFSEAKIKALVARQAPELQFISYDPAWLDSHQDVLVYQKA